MDGVSLTHGGNPKRHIWTFVAAHDDMFGTRQIPSICQCVLSSNRRIMAPPSFVGMDYFCDTRNQRNPAPTDIKLFPDPRAETMKTSPYLMLKFMYSSVLRHLHYKVV